MSSSRFRASSLALALLGCALLVLPACSTSESSTAEGSSTTTAVPGQHGSDDGGDVDFDAAIGDCVELTGSMTKADIDHADCGSQKSNFKVVGKSPTKDGCASDVDQTYYVSLNGEEQGALCLDIDWVEGGCMTVPFVGNPARSDCTPGQSNTVRVLKVLSGTADSAACPAEATRYYAYDERKLITCVERV